MDILKELNIDEATLKAVKEVESNGSGFNKDGTIKCLFEAHHFKKFTNGIYDEKYPHLSSPYSKSRDYYKGNQNSRLLEAKTLNEEAALKSASYGMFQIMGFNYNLCGYSNVIDFYIDMNVSEDKQLEIFFKFVRNHPKMLKALQDKNWKEFARQYNGSDYTINSYDVKLEKAYNKYK